MTTEEPMLMVRNLAGVDIARLSPIPSNVKELKQAIEVNYGTPCGLQQLMHSGCVLKDDDKLSDESAEIVLIVDETPMWSWDVSSNPAANLLTVEGPANVRYTDARKDYVNVVTQEPVRGGMHFFEFVMHKIGDEQVCGVFPDRSHEGPAQGIRSLRGWSYYCGRRYSEYPDICDGLGALHVEGRAIKEFEKVNSGDVIGMIIDMERGKIAFMLNGKVQGVCGIPKQPLYLGTHVDAQDDHVELRKPSIIDAPLAAIEALSEPLPVYGEGKSLCYQPRSEEVGQLRYSDTSYYGRQRIY